jgi:hypothetical protein
MGKHIKILNCRRRRNSNSCISSFGGGIAPGAPTAATEEYDGSQLGQVVLEI